MSFSFSSLSSGIIHCEWVSGVISFMLFGMYLFSVVSYCLIFPLGIEMC